MVAVDRAIGAAGATLRRRGARGLRAAGGSPGGVAAGGLPTEENSSVGDLPGADLPGGDLPVGDLPAVGLPAGQAPRLDFASVALPVGDFPVADFPTGDSAAGALPAGGLPADDLAADFSAEDLPAGDLPTAVSAGRAAAARARFADPPAGGRGRERPRERPARRLPRRRERRDPRCGQGRCGQASAASTYAHHRRHGPGMGAQQDPPVVRGNPQQRCGVQDHGGHEDRERKNQDHPPHAGPALPGRAREGKPGVRPGNVRYRRAGGADAGAPVTARNGPAEPPQPGSWPSIRNRSVRAACSRIAWASWYCGE